MPPPSLSSAGLRKRLSQASPPQALCPLEGAGQRDQDRLPTSTASVRSVFRGVKHDA